MNSERVGERGTHTSVMSTSSSIGFFDDRDIVPGWTGGRTDGWMDGWMIEGWKVGRLAEQSRGAARRCGVGVSLLRSPQKGLDSPLKHAMGEEEDGRNSVLLPVLYIIYMHIHTCRLSGERKLPVRTNQPTSHCITRSNYRIATCADIMAHTSRIKQNMNITSGAYIYTGIYTCM